MFGTNRQLVAGRLAAAGIAGLLACVLASCGVKKEEPTGTVPPTPVYQPAPPGSGGYDPFSYPSKSKSPAQPNGGHKVFKPPAAAGEGPAGESAADYKVKLGADPVLTIPGPPGQLFVWIGLPPYEPEYLGMAIKTDTIPATGKTARVKPVAPGLKVEPDASICMKTNPRGSEVRFTLTPIDAGTFKVGADVTLFESNDCSGAPIPKATRNLRVDVRVDYVKLTLKYLTELWDVFWKKLLQFWGEVLAAFFAVLLILFRKKLKKWLGAGE